MPRTKRQDLKRQVAHAMNNINRAILHLYEVERLFQGVHPELDDALKTAIVGLDTSKSVIEQFVIAAWGELPEGWESWRAEGSG